MFETFTTRAKKVLEFAKSEAIRCGDGCVGTQHILFGLVKEGSGIAHHVLARNGITTKYVSDESDKMVQKGSGAVRNPAWTPRAHRVFEHSLNAAKELGHNYVGTEHLLLGLFKEGESVAIQVLSNYKIQIEQLKRETLELLGFYNKTYLFKPVEVGVHALIIVEDGKEEVIGRYEELTDELLFNRPLSTDEISHIIEAVRKR